jgi:hypothetical protein
MKTLTSLYDKQLAIIKRLHDTMQNQMKTDAALADQLLHDLAWNVLELRKTLHDAMPTLRRPVRTVQPDNRP